MKPLNFDKHHVEKRHNSRYLGIFLMFAVIAVVVGILLAFNIANMTGYGFFDFLLQGTTAPVEEGGSGGGVGGSVGNGSALATYRGVLNMLNKCSLTVTWENTNCDFECARQNLGTCIDAYAIDYSGHVTFPYECTWYLASETNRSLTCQCCKVPLNTS